MRSIESKLYAGIDYDFDQNLFGRLLLILCRQSFAILRDVDAEK
jgi:hypothetical protein